MLTTSTIADFKGLQKRFYEFSPNNFRFFHYSTLNASICLAMQHPNKISLLIQQYIKHLTMQPLKPQMIIKFFGCEEKFKPEEIWTYLVWQTLKKFLPANIAVNRFVFKFLTYIPHQLSFEHSSGGVIVNTPKLWVRISAGAIWKMLKKYQKVFYYLKSS